MKPPSRPRPKPPEKKPPWEEGAGRRKILSFGEVIDRSIGAARGANGVAEGALNVRAPRLPNEEPPPMRAKASPAKPSASVAARIKIKDLWRNAMASYPNVERTSSGPAPAIWGQTQEAQRSHVRGTRMA